SLLFTTLTESASPASSSIIFPHLLALSSKSLHQRPHSFPTRRSSDLSRSDSVYGPAAGHWGVWYFADQDFETVVQNLTTYLQFLDRKSTRLNSSHGSISYAVFCLKKKNTVAIDAL